MYRRKIQYYVHIRLTLMKQENSSFGFSMPDGAEAAEYDAYVKM